MLFKAFLGIKRCVDLIIFICTNPWWVEHVLMGFKCVTNLWPGIQLIPHILSPLLTFMFLISYHILLPYHSFLPYHHLLLYQNLSATTVFVYGFLGTGAVCSLFAWQHRVRVAKRSCYGRRGGCSGKSCKRARVHRKIARGTTSTPLCLDLNDIHEHFFPLTFLILLFHCFGLPLEVSFFEFFASYVSNVDAKKCVIVFILRQELCLLL